MTRVLVAYATRNGSTREVAEQIAATLERGRTRFLARHGGELAPRFARVAYR